ncbi:hypothetical protein PRIEUP_LOCUS1261 [Pristimantis euphronides]
MPGTKKKLKKKNVKTSTRIETVEKPKPESHFTQFLPPVSGAKYLLTLWREPQEWEQNSVGRPFIQFNEISRAPGKNIQSPRSPKTCRITWKSLDKDTHYYFNCMLFIMVLFIFSKFLPNLTYFTNLNFKAFQELVTNWHKISTENWKKNFHLLTLIKMGK